jgi:acetyl-CoA acetyltransferase
MAGVDAKDIDFAELYDCFSISAIVQAELLWLCERGGGGKLFADGHTFPGGRIPINTSGGHMSGAYIPGANLVVEAVRQLRRERGAAQVPNAEIAAVAGIGANAHATAIFTKVS